MNLEIKFDSEGHDNGVLDLLEDKYSLPKKESRKERLTRIYGDMWDMPKFDHPQHRSDKNNIPDTIANRIVEHYIGKPFNKAFSYYCTKVPKHEQDVFLKLFDQYRSWLPTYRVDEAGNIQANPDRGKRYQHPEKTDITLKSYDYETGFYDLDTKRIVTKEDTNRSRYRSWWWYKDNSHYIEVILKGYEKTFESKKDPEYIRMWAENEKAKRLNAKALEKWNRAKAYSFLTDSEKEHKKQMEESVLVRDNHGFDETAFIDRKYHGQKRKWQKEKPTASVIATEGTEL